ncbi:MAG: MFS transporter [Candidatus Eremiobacteraeota bacterium]|nr:MFS transporter [Candidatus Eremiobacteraeota bacterium]MBV8372895.1 MFS transporter [Candidatus Eremiobacteraeota bacterium]
MAKHDAPSAAAGNWIIAATVLGSSLVFIDGTIVSIALPIIQTGFRATTFDAQWVIEAYTLVLGALMLLSGALGDRYGRKRLFLLGVVVFAIGSICCGIAPSMPALIASRVLQGAGGTMLAPASLALIGASFEGEARGRAIGLWSGLTAVAGAIGPVAGGSIVDHLGWRWVFFINIPIALAVLAIGAWHMRESRDEGETGRLDVIGSALITLALGGIVYAFVVSGLDGWGMRAIGALSGGLVMLAAFFVVERRTANPILPFELFANRAFSGINIMTFLLYGALGGMFFFLPFVMILADGYSATFTGLAMLPFLALIVVLSRYSGTLAYRVGRRALLVAGPSLSALGFVAFAALPNLHYWTGVLPSILLVGVGMGLTVAPLVATLIDSVPEQHVGLASGINNAVSRVAGLLAIAVLGAVLAAAYNARLEMRANQAGLSASQRSDVNAQRAAMAAARLRDPREASVVHVTYIDGFRVVAAICVFLAAGSAITAGFTLGAQRQQRSSP